MAWPKLLQVFPLENSFCSYQFSNMSVCFIHQILSCILQFDCFKSLLRWKFLSWTWSRRCHWLLKVIQEEHSGKGVSRNLQKKKEGWNISNIKQGLPKVEIQEKGEGIPGFFYCPEYKVNIATLLSFSYTELENLLIYCLFSSLTTIPLQ